MRDSEHFKAIAAQMITLSAELLRLIDNDESERAAVIEAVKKRPTVIYCISRR